MRLRSAAGSAAAVPPVVGFVGMSWVGTHTGGAPPVCAGSVSGNSR